MALEDYKADALRCTRCSYCKWIPFDLVKSWRFAKGCPSVEWGKFHAYSGGGKLVTGLSLLEGRAEITDRVVDVAFRCVTCGLCDVSCKVCRYDMEPLGGIHALREHLVERGRVPEAHGEILAKARENRDSAEKKAERGALVAGVKDLLKEKAEVAFHAGCRAAFFGEVSSSARISLRLLSEAGVDYGVLGPEEGCCGGKLYHMGYRGEFERAAKQMIEKWQTAGVKTVVTACADCYHTFKRLYPEVGSEVEVRHIVEYTDELIKEGKVSFTKRVPLKVTYHDPCHLGRQGEPYVEWHGKEKKIYGQAVVYEPRRPRYIGAYGVYDAPRNVLKAIPGVELVEMERIREASWCCGAGGGARETYPEFSAWVASERIEEAEATGADALVTACPGCERNFQDAVEAKGAPMKVLDVMDLVARAL